MITIKAAFTDKDTTLGLLGRVGENETRQIEFDCSEILTEYPAAMIVCAVKRPDEESAYYADMQAEGALRRLILRDVETEKPGTLKLELSALDGEKQRRTTLYAGAIASGLTRTDQEPSDPEKDLIDYIADAETVKQEASNAAKDALAAAGRAADAASEIENMTANAVTLAPGEPATANYNAGVLTIGVPKGDKGDPGKDANVTAENIQSALGYAPVSDVQINGNSVLIDGVANVPIANEFGKTGVVKLSPAGGIKWSNNIDALSVDYASQNAIGSRSPSNNPIIPYYLDFAVRAAMCDGKGAVWTDIEQASARERLGQEAINRDLERRLTNLEYAAQGYLYREETDAVSVYEKAVPDDVTPWITLDRIGGRTLVWNQMVNASLFPDSIIISGNESVPVSKEGGSIVFPAEYYNGVKYYYYIANFPSFAVGHKVLIRGCPAGGGMETFQLYLQGNHIIRDEGEGAIVTIESENFQPMIRIASGDHPEMVFTPQMFDLTVLFGAGNEPSTAAEFQAMFPALYYPYAEPVLLSFSCTEVVSSGKDGTVKQALDMSAIASKYFPDGMCSAGNVHDELNLEGGVAIQRVDRYVFDGSEKWTLAAEYDICCRFDTSALRNGTGNAAAANVICNKLKTNADASVDKVGCCLTGNAPSRLFSIFLPKAEYPDADSVQQYIKGMADAGDPLIAYYGLYTPIETPITEELTVDIEVESGGTLIFANDQGDAYHVPVPNQETWMVKLGG